MAQLTCENCGGTDFYQETGKYFCNECQFQSQEVQEHAVQEEEVLLNVTRGKRKIASQDVDKTGNKITSWECYNYILLGLTQELINLGASKSLKTVVRILWLRYLEKLQVYKCNKNELPRLQAVNCKLDGDIVYGRKRKKRASSTKSSSDELDATTLDSSSQKRTTSRQKRAAMQAAYDVSQSQGTPPSLHNETLQSIQTSSDKSSRKTSVTFNTYASKELRKKQSLAHFKKHRNDFEHELKCHNMSYRKASYRYRVSPHVLSPNKLYAVLYLALLINKESIQLGDMLRFIMEGHLSFNCYGHFFPEEFLDKFLNYRDFKKNSLFCTNRFRRMASDLAVFLDVTSYISCPNLVALCGRYCTELNLPDEICNYAKNIMVRTKMKMPCRKRPFRIPNYEARPLSVIIFVLKLLFGLDDATEFELSNYAKIVNSSGSVYQDMFDVVGWLKHISYRHAVISSHHFPTSFSNEHDSLKNIKTFLDFVYKRQLPETKFNKEKDNVNHMLNKLKSGLSPPNAIEFDVSFTPFFDYTRRLLEENKGEDCLENLLWQDFRNARLTCILRPANFLKELNGMEPEIIHGGANDDWILEPISCYEHQRKIAITSRRRLVTVRLTLAEKNTVPTETPVTKDNVSGANLRFNFQLSNKSNFEKNTKKLKHRSDEIDPGFMKNPSKECLKHYRPFEMYWLRLHMRIDALTNNLSHDFLKELPFNFQLIFGECQRITQQSQQELLEELQLTELYLLYCVRYEHTYLNNRPVKNRILENFLKSCIKVW